MKSKSYGSIKLIGILMYKQFFNKKSLKLFFYKKADDNNLYIMNGHDISEIFLLYYKKMVWLRQLENKSVSNFNHRMNITLLYKYKNFNW